MKEEINPVAPHEGAWIEISGDTVRSSGKMSHPMRVRGLKSAD